MNYTTLGIGILAIAFGAGSGVMRFVKPSSFRKLGAMKERFGAMPGSIIHFVAYVLLPLGFGIAMVIAGFNGVSFFGPTG